MVQKILSESGILKPLQTTLEELKAGFGASGIELIPYKVISVNGKRGDPQKDLSKQDGKYLESENVQFEVVLEILPKKSNKPEETSDDTNNNNNTNTNTNVMPDEEELPYLTHFVISAPLKQLSDKHSAAKDILCFLSNGKTV